MHLNLTSVWKVMTIWISRELSLFNLEHLYMWCAWIGPPSEKQWPFEFLESFRCTISSISICDAPESDLRLKSYDHLNFSRASVVQFRASRYIMHLKLTSVSKLWPVEFLESFRCSILSVSIYYVPESDIRVKTYDHSNFSRASVVQFRASRYIMSPNRTSEPNVMTIRISRELPLFNFERLDELWASIIHSRQKLGPFEFVESFRGQFQGSRYMMHVNRASKWKVIAIWISLELTLFNF